MSRMLRAMVALSVLLSLGSVALGATANWGEECDGAPDPAVWAVWGAGDYSSSGYWLGGTYVAGEGLPQPLLNQASYTVDFRFKTADDWDGVSGGWVMAIEQECTGTQTIGYELGYNGFENRIAHTFTKSGAVPNHIVQESWNIPQQYVGNLAGGTWYLARVVSDADAGTMTTYVDGQVVFEQDYLGPNPYADGRLLVNVGYDGNYPSTLDYIRTYNGALDATTPLNAVPEPMSLVLLAVGGLLSLLRRRR